MPISREELESFYSEIEVKIFNFALRWTWNPGLAEDLVQESFVRIWRHRDEVDPSHVKSLLYKTVQNLALNQRRRQKLADAIPVIGWFMPTEYQTLEQDFIQKENLRELQAALDSMPLDLRETLLMCQFSDMSYSEIAVALGISIGTVGSRRNRALEFLKENMKG